MNKIGVTVALVAVAGGAWWWFGRGSGSGAGEIHFRTAKVERGEVIEGVQASGTVQPVLLVQVGTQISGEVSKLFKDFNSKVKAGETIALLDSRRLEAQVAQDEASVARAKADVERMKAVVTQSRTDVEHAKAALDQSKADIDRVKALLEQADKDLARQKELGEKRLVSASDVDAAVALKGSLDAQLAAAQAAVRTNDAQVASAEASVRANEAQVAVGEAAVRQSQALLQGDKVNLDYATITSPVDGVIVSRNVDVGQTVAASLSAPTLFVIANDLTKIQVQASVPEADVGRIKEGQHARFAVDAHQDRTFDGVVSQVRLASTTVQNVVTYTVLVDASNPDGLLLPGMTANLTFEIAKSDKDALHVPTSALRLQPPQDVPNLVDNPEALAEKPKTDAPKADPPGDSASSGAPPADGSGGGPGKGRKGGGGRKRRGLVYVAAAGNRLHAVPVRVGISDGVQTVVESVDGGALAEGADLVTAVLRDEEPAATNPFAPPRMGGAPQRPAGR